MSMREYVIIVAGGKGSRMGGELPKQFLPVAGIPVLMRTLTAFYTYNRQIHIIVALPPAQQDYWRGLCEKSECRIPHVVVDGGETRFHSVRNALQRVDAPALVAVHDGVRPFVSQEVIARCYEAAAKYAAAVPVIEPVETLRHVEVGGSKTVDRASYRLVQTPQVFDAALLKKAYEQDYTPFFTDDASVVEALNVSVCLVEGNRENIKITTPSDLRIAASLCNKDV